MNEKIYEAEKNRYIRLFEELYYESSSFNKKFLENNSDILILVIRTHLHIESLINRLIVDIFPNPKSLMKKNVSFGNKIELLKCMGINSDPIHKIILITRLRNNFAHNQHYSIPKEQIDLLCKGYNVSDATSDYEKLYSVFAQITGSLVTIITDIKIFPFANVYYNFDSIIKNDRFKKFNTLNEVYNESFIQKVRSACADRVSEILQEKDK